MAAAIPQTPQRPLPGGWMTTPGPQRQQQPQPNFGTFPSFPAASSNRQSISGPAGQQPASKPPATGPSSLVPYPSLPLVSASSGAASNDLPLVERAARTINDVLADEARFPALDNYISQGYSTAADYSIPSSAAWSPFQKIKTYDIPDRIFEQYNQAQVSTMMGLFSDIGHAWISIDNALYLWDYTHPNPELIGFEEQPNSITAVELVWPRPGVFVDAISRLLVVATTNDLFLIGVSVQATEQGAKTVSLYQTRMQVPIRGISVQIIAGSPKSGRIFFGGRGDDDVYELIYQQEEGWFSSRCTKINHTRKGVQTMLPANPFVKKGPAEYLLQMVVDDTRNCLYTLSSTSTIRVLYMRDASSLDLSITKSFRDIQFDLGHRVGPSANFSKTSIVSITPVSGKEASRISIVATTSTGCRIYFSAVTSSYYGGDSTSAPSSMMVHHIRFPPADPSAPSSARPADGASNAPPPAGVVPTYQNPTDISSQALTPARVGKRFPPGYFFCLVTQSQPGSGDLLFMAAPDSARIAHPQDPSQANRFPEYGNWVSLESRAEDIGLITPPFAAATTPLGFGNELAVQFDQPVTEVAVLTNSGVHTFRRRRLVDTFAAAIRAGGGPDGLDGEVRNLVRMYGRSETIATALAVACGQGSDVTTDARIARVADPDILEYARKTFIEHGGKPLLNENSVIDQNVSAIDNVRPSPRAEGLAIYIARILRSVWKSKIILEKTNPTGGFQVSPTVPLSKLQEIQRDLSRLQEFLNANQTFIEGLAGPEALGRVSTKADEIALQGEHRALNALVKLIGDVIEGISFVLVLFDERVNEIILSIPEQSRADIRTITYENLFCSKPGKELAKELVKAIVNRNIAQGSNVDTVTDALRRRCGSFCSADDCVIFKAQEQLKRASDTTSSSELSRGLLNESLRLLQKVAASLSKEQLRWAVEHYIGLEFFAGAIQLCLSVAQESDRGDRALAWIHDGSPPQDSRAASFQSRLECYELIHQVIIAVDRMASSKPEMEDGVYTVAAKRKREADDVIESSQDQVFQITLYDWFLSQGWTERILEIKSPHVISYLQRKARENIAHADLLWQYHARYSNFIDAARVQFHLAKSDFDLTLEKRMEYLSYARANASTKPVGVSEMGRARQARQDLIHEISDLLDLAIIQGDIMSRLKGETRLIGERRAEVIAALNGKVQPLDVLFNTYADQAGYHDLCILIYQIADYRSPGDVKASWQNLIESTHQEAVEQGQYPYEMVAEKTRSLGQRLHLSDSTFPVPMLLPMLKKYSFEHQRDVAPPTWVVDIFIDLGVPWETIVLTLESLFYQDDVPFRGRNRRHVAIDLIYAVSKWFSISSTEIGGGFGLSGLRGSGVDRGELFGSEDMALQTVQVLVDVVESDVLDEEMREAAVQLRARIEQLMR